MSTDRILLGQVLPSSAGPENPEDSFEALAIVRWWSTATLARLPLRQMRLDLGPLLVGEALHDNGRSRLMIARKISKCSAANRSI